MNNDKKEKFPSNDRYKQVVLGALTVGIINLIFFIRIFFILPHHGAKISQAGIDALISMARILALVCAPLASISLFYIAIVMWLYFKKCNTDSDQSGEDKGSQPYYLGDLRTPVDKLKKADRDLVVASIACIIVGVILAGVSLSVYLKHDFEFLNGEKPVSVAVSRVLISLAKFFAYVALPVLASGYFLFAFCIWNYRRKRGKLTPNTAP